MHWVKGSPAAGMHLHVILSYLYRKDILGIGREILATLALSQTFIKIVRLDHSVSQWNPFRRGTYSHQT